MVLASAALKAPKAGVSAMRWSKLRNKLLVHHPEDLLVVYELELKKCGCVLR